MPVRTKLLGEGLQTTGGQFTIAYTCPPGETTILKEVRVFPTGPAVTRLVVSLRSGPRDVFIMDVTAPAKGDARLECWSVLQPGDTIGVFSDQNSGAHYRLSGTELEGVAD